MRIDWVNHASFVLDTGGVRMISDPWLEGFAFDRGWRLLSETRFGYDEFAGITHIWFSHEHPDHFSPPVIRKIPEEFRRRIPVLYQKTRDGKVAAYCRKLGFADVIELEHGRWTNVAPDLDVMCRPMGADDSWLCVRTPDRMLLNLNDCVIRTAEECDEIRSLIGDREIDVLLTQFSYAAWAGNEGDDDAQRASAREKLERVKLQIERFRPKHVIPFASFVWFCHEENHYLNRGINRIEDAHSFIEGLGLTRSVVLYPGESWNVGDDHDSAASIERYRPDYERAFDAPDLVHAEPVPLEQLKAHAAAFVERFQEKNGGLLFKLARIRKPFPVARIDVADLDLQVEFSLEKGLRAVEADPASCDIRLGSEALSYCFREEWGGETLNVNGRFQAPPGGDVDRFRVYFELAGFNNRGISYTRLVTQGLLRRIAGSPRSG